MRTFVKTWIGIAFIAMGFGAVLLIITFASGARFDQIFRDNGTNIGYHSNNTFSLQESYNGVKSIDIDVSYGEVDIQTGETFSIDASRLPENGLEAYVENGTWMIKEKGDKEHIRIFDFNIPEDGILWDSYNTPIITITVPEDFTADDFKLKVSAGEVTAEKINAKTGEFEVSAGRFTVDELNITDKSDYSVGAGQIEINSIQAKDITVDCGVGEIVIEGSVFGDNDITCNVGNVELYLDGTEDDYSYDITRSLGNIDVGEESYQNVSEKVINHNGAENKLKLNCEIGNITVDFN